MLRGDKSADLPVRANLKTAKVTDLEVPPMLLAYATVCPQLAGADIRSKPADSGFDPELT